MSFELFPLLHSRWILSNQICIINYLTEKIAANLIKIHSDELNLSLYELL